MLRTLSPVVLSGGFAVLLVRRLLLLTAQIFFNRLLFDHFLILGSDHLFAGIPHTADGKDKDHQLINEERKQRQ